MVGGTVIFWYPHHDAVQPERSGHNSPRKKSGGPCSFCGIRIRIDVNLKAHADSLLWQPLQGPITLNVETVSSKVAIVLACSSCEYPKNSWSFLNIHHLGTIVTTCDHALIFSRVSLRGRRHFFSELA